MNLKHAKVEQFTPKEKASEALAEALEFVKKEESGKYGTTVLSIDLSYTEDAEVYATVVYESI